MKDKKQKQRYEESFYQKINNVADWIIRLIMINILMIITSLPVLTLYSSLSAGYQLWHDYVNKEETKLFSGYFTYFKTRFMKKLSIGSVLSLIIVIGYLDATYYAQIADVSIFYKLGYFVMIAMLTTGFIVTLFTLVVFQVFPEAKIPLMFKLALYLSGKYFFRLVLLFMTMIIPIAMMMFPITQLIFVFIGISGPLLLNVLITKKIIIYLEGMKENATD